MSRTSCLVLAVATLLPATAFSQTPGAGDAKGAPRFPVEVVSDIAYREGKDADPSKHKLDLFLPKGRKDFPVLFFVHGGGWTTGDRKLYGQFGRVFAARGIGTVVISYRLSPQVQHPAHIEDVARAFAWTHKNIGKYGGRADQIFVTGQSAGGHLAALLATNETYLKAENLGLKDIKGAMPMSGIYLFRPGWLDRVIGSGPEAADNASPLNHVSENSPPFLILYAERISRLRSDVEVPPRRLDAAQDPRVLRRDQGPESHQHHRPPHVQRVRPGHRGGSSGSSPSIRPIAATPQAMP